MDFVSKNFGFAPGERCVIIGEIGVNHNRQEDMLFRLIDEGAKAGVDIIKLQRFVSEEEISTFAAAADYQQKAGQGESQLEMAKKLELPDEWLFKAYEYCKEKNIGFLCTAFDHSSVDFLSKKLGTKSVKVPSPELSNKPLLEHMARAFDGLLISTGASYLDECTRALDWLRAQAENEIAMMHCVSEYPAPYEQANLRSIVTMRNAYGLPVGYSDHCEGSVPAIVAVALGASMIEKHFTLDRNLPGPDHKASLDIDELTMFVKDVRDAHLTLGDGTKRPVAAEASNRALIRKSVVCASPGLSVGTVIEMPMLGIKRPWVEGAVEPFEIDRLIGRKLKTAKQYDHPILWKDLEP